MHEIEDFRVYYNHTIHPELMRMERQRLRLLRLLAISAVLLAGALVVEMYLNILVLTLFMSIPVAFYIIYLVYKAQQFRRTFKPQVVNLILDFIDDLPNYGQLTYDPVRLIPKSQFLESSIFRTSGQYYIGEDFISGTVGEMPFEMCELRVREISPVANKLDDVFEGIFLHGIFNEETEGRLIVWPRYMRKHLIATIKQFTFHGGVNVDHEIMIDEFRDKFLVYATEDTHVIGILPEPMQEAILNYTKRTGRDFYFSVHNREIYAAVTNEKDLLEPNLFSSNLNFDLIREFYEDISMILKVVQVFDQTH